MASIFVGCVGSTTPSDPQATQRPISAGHALAIPSQALARRGPLFPRNRVVAFYGAAGVPAMGVLGSAPPDVLATRLLLKARAYDAFGRPVIPAFELIVVIAQGAPGKSGRYNGATDDATVRRYLATARRMKGILIIDIQPGRSKFLPEVKRYAEFIRQPDVGLALDPEWEMDSTQVPGQTIGGTTGAEVNGVGEYLSALVRKYRLPQKLFVIHQFTPDMIEHRSVVLSHPELATTFHVDGFGHRPNKLSKYHILASREARFHNGIKLFYQQDIDIFTPREIMQLRPQPDLITYQ